MAVLILLVGCVLLDLSSISAQSGESVQFHATKYVVKLAKNFNSTRSVSLRPSGQVLVCLGGNATFTCMTTGGALVWETSSETGNSVFNSPNEPPAELGIFELTLLSFAQRSVDGMTELEVSSTATATNLQPSVDGVTLNCSESILSQDVQATLVIAGKYLLCWPSYVILLIIIVTSVLLVVPCSTMNVGLLLYPNLTSRCNIILIHVALVWNV